MTARRIRLLVVLAMAWLTPVDVLAADAAALGEREGRWALGQRIYREGVGANGEPLVAQGAAGMRLSGKDAACAACHRRSGYGSSEGRFVVRPVTGPALTQTLNLPVHSPRIKARLGTSPRPPYDEVLLARAIRGGLDTAGKPLDPVMPRYALSDDEMRALSSYLFSLSAQPSPGVDEQDIHFATVIQPGVAPERRRAMLEVMNAFVRDKDANVRQDEARREAGNMRMYRAYRKWVLHVWELSGPSDTWRGQLEVLYRQQPVFALIGGLGDEWRPIHEFSEDLELPCIFPQSELPVVAGPSHYTVYFSRGVVLEAEVLAKYLSEQGGGGKVAQVWRRGDAVGEAAAAAMRAAWSARGGAAPALGEIVLDAAPDAGLWSRVRESGATAITLWLGAADLASVPAPPGASSPTIYLSSSRLPGRAPPVLATAEVRLVYPSEAGPRREARLLRNKLWLHNKGIALTDETVQINTQFAMTVVSDVLGHMMDGFSRDFFVERIEHVVGQTPTASVYQSVSLGPGQRFAAKGASVVQVVDARKGQVKAVSGWIVP